MNDDQITAISREYAEFTDLSPVDKKNVSMICENFLKYMLRRYYLMEKENIKKYFQSRNYILTHQDKYEVYLVLESEVEMKLLRCLFPEITKGPNEILTSSDKLTLGKQEVNAKPAESKSMQLSDVKAKIDAWMENHTDEEVYECLKKYGAVEDVDTVIQGWVARDENGDLVCCAGSKPYKEENIPFWKVNFRNFIECIPNDLFPDLTWESDPIEVEIIIKRKKK